MGLLQIWALPSGNNTTVQFLVTDSVNRMQAKKGEKICDCCGQSFMLSPLPAQWFFPPEPTYHSLKNILSISFLCFFFKSLFFSSDKEITILSCGRAKLCSGNCSWEKKVKTVLENFSSLEHILRGLCIDLKNTDMICIFLECCYFYSFSSFLFDLKVIYIPVFSSSL